MNGRTLALLGVAQAALVIVLWSLIPFAFIPSPLEVIHQMNVQVTERGLLYELWVSFCLNIEAVAIAILIAFGFAYGYVVPFVRPIANFVANLRNFGIIGLSFVFMLMISDTHWIKVTLLVFAMLPYLTAPLVEEVRTIEDSRFNHARTMKLGHLGTTWQVVVRGKLYEMIEVIRQNAAIGWMMVGSVEGLLRGEGGVGVMLVEQSKYLRLDALFAILTFIFAIGWFQSFAIRWIGNLVCPYATLNARSL